MSYSISIYLSLYRVSQHKWQVLSLYRVCQHKWQIWNGWHSVSFQDIYKKSKSQITIRYECFFKLMKFLKSIKILQYLVKEVKNDNTLVSKNDNILDFRMQKV